MTADVGNKSAGGPFLIVGWMLVTDARLPGGIIGAAFAQDRSWIDMIIPAMALWLIGIGLAQVETLSSAEWSVSPEGSHLITIDRQFDVSYIRWKALPSLKAVARTEAPGEDIRDTLLLPGGRTALVSSEKGLWRCGIDGGRTLINNGIFSRLALIDYDSDSHYSVVALSNYAAIVIRVSRRKNVFTRSETGSTRPFSNDSPIIVLDRGIVVFPDQQEKLVVAEGKFLPLFLKWPVRGIYDTYTNTNGSRLLFYFNSAIDPTNNSHFQWLSTSCKLMIEPGVFRKFAFPEAIRVFDAFITDKNILWVQCQKKGHADYQLRSFDMNRLLRKKAGLLPETEDKTR